ncbi:capsule assembly Wzi family protein [Lutibacter sp. A80]|uniref:capsule assembly Wzi family protein n=1 Tax=Lutibacter sp. A80 TaxID=2918453 RepID=UPI001F064FC1|nr:capsule assembly Wzi family protein [Lutibacter sp. A80]UMB60805.1 capsule assembly Wzi family protein [Lutibacter sp. A80]
MKFKLFLAVVTLMFCVKINAQNAGIEYELALNSGVATAESMPFWMVANRFGTIPDAASYGLVDASIASNYNRLTNQLTFNYKASIIGGNDVSKNNLFINELYGGLQYKNWELTVGVKHQDLLWEGLSSSNGSITMATNARSYPGYNLRLINFVKLPFAKKWLSVKGNYGDYFLNDKRMVADARLHIKSLYLKSKLSSKLEMITGLNHYAQWAGTSSKYGKQPSGFKNYLRVISGSSGGSDATGGDQINVIGNQLGSYLLQFNYKGNQYNWNFYWSHPFEDRSGRELMNYPDALYGVFVDLKKPEAFISHVLAEVTYTKHASGDDPHYTDEFGFHAASGMDNYFNNWVYESGWTYFGNTIGSPYFTTKPVNEEGITQGVITGDNRFLAFNIGVKGMVKNTFYKALLSSTTYYGWFGSEYVDTPNQISGLLEVTIPKIPIFPIEITMGAAFDTGTYRPVNFGGFLKLSSRGIF